MTKALVAMLLVFPLLWGCSPTVTVKHKVAPIHITVDVNVKVQEELDDFFDFEDEVEEREPQEEQSEETEEGSQG